MNEQLNNMADYEARHIIASNADHKAKIKIVGVGGAGGNAVNRMVSMNIKDVEFIAINTDALALDNNLADEKIAIGQKTTKTLGAGAKPEVGRQALMEDKETVEHKLEGADMVFISAGMGGGTGTGAAPVVAEIAHKLGILTVAVVTMPFKWEGPIRRRNAEKGLAALRQAVDSIIVINNQRIMEVIEKNTPMKDAFLKVDEVLGNAVRSICDIMFIHGTINVDFNDARTIMQNGGSALMGTGTASGEGRTLKAAQEAIACPLLDNVKVSGASGALINVAHGENFSMFEYNEALEFLYEQIGEENVPNIVAGDVTIPELGDRVSITVIATGFEKNNEEEAAFEAPVAKAAAPKASVPHVEQSIERPTIDWAKAAQMPVEESAPVAQAPVSAPVAAPAAPAPVAQAPIAKAPIAQAPAAPAVESAPLQQTMQFEASPTQRTRVIRPVEAPIAEERPRQTAPMFADSFLNPEFNVRRQVVEEDVPTMVMPKVNATPLRTMAAPAVAKPVEEPIAAAEENPYGMPAFLKPSISEDEF